MTFLKRGAAIGAVLSALLVTGGSVAIAQEQGEPAEPAERATVFCERWLPRIETRTARLVERITGDADTRGSAEWLRARAGRERDAGRETTARLLEERAERRTGRVEELKQTRQWAEDFRAESCPG
jgi:hypothetical protein